MEQFKSNNIHVSIRDSSIPARTISQKSVEFTRRKRSKPKITRVNPRRSNTNVFKENFHSKNNQKTFSFQNKFQPTVANEQTQNHISNEFHDRPPSLITEKTIYKSMENNNDGSSTRSVIINSNQHSPLFEDLKRIKNQNSHKNKFWRDCSWVKISITTLVVVIGICTLTGIAIGIYFATRPSNISSVETTRCASLCPGERWTFTSGLLARWSFDNNYNDLTNAYNATAFNNPSFTTTGYINQALLLSSSSMQSLVVTYLPLASTSFTIEAWIRPTSLSNTKDHSIIGLCPSLSSNQCLHVVLRKNSSNYYLYFGFYNNDCQGNTIITVNRWIHVAFVFDITSLIQSIYIDGILDNNCSTTSPFVATQGDVTIGTIPAMISTQGLNFYQGNIDHLSITKRAKSSCEILEDASLTTCYLFDESDVYVDSGPNNLPNTYSSTTIVSSGYSGSAISFNGSTYFQVSSFNALGTSNKPYSIMLWIRPNSTNGVLVHVSASSNGLSWCIPFIGITGNRSVVANSYNGGGVSITGSSIPGIPSWSHLGQTWSTTNGLRLYVNGTIVASSPSMVSFSASNTNNYVTLGHSLSGTASCLSGGLSSSARLPIIGDIDEFRVYNRELSINEIALIIQS